MTRLPFPILLRGLFCLAILAAGLFAPYNPAEQHRESAFQAPNQTYLLGTDQYGRDQLSRLLHGGRLSLSRALLATALSLLFALLLGAVAGYHGGWIDGVLMRLSEVFVALPWLYLLLALRAGMPLNLRPETTFLLLSALIGCLGWARPARLVRGVVLSAREREYVHAAPGFGAGDCYLLRHHVLPETYSILLTQAGLSARSSITSVQ